MKYRITWENKKIYIWWHGHLKIWTSIYHMTLNYQQKRNSDFILKSNQYFCFKLCYGQYKTRVNRRWLFFKHVCPEMQADEIHCTLWISITKCHFHSTSNLTELCMFWWAFSKEDVLNNNNNSLLPPALILTFLPFYGLPRWL